MFIAKEIILDDIVRVLNGEKVYLSRQSFEVMQKTRRFIAERVTKGEVIYGVNTGVGALATAVLSADEAKKLQERLLMSHAVGYGDFAPDDIVLITMLLRANMLAKGYSGVRPEIVIFLLTLINERIIPRIPRYGSVGASGDLAPLAFLALVLTGYKLASAKHKGRIIKGTELQKVLLDVYKKSLEEYRSEGYNVDFSILGDGKDDFVVKLSYKEGLALINGTEFETAVLAKTYLDAKRSFEVAKKAVALTMEALRAIKNAFYEDAVRLIGLSEAVDVSNDILGLVEGSKLVVDSKDLICLKNFLKKTEEGLYLSLEDAQRYGVSIEHITKLLEKLSGQRSVVVKVDAGYVIKGIDLDPANTCVNWYQLGFIQDAYSIRCVPKVMGTVLKGLKFVEKLLISEMNSVTDNPLIICDGNECDVVSAGNFHGQTVALASEVLSKVLAYLAGISERRIFRLLDKALNRGLSPFLVKRSGINSGLMITQYLAASLVNKIGNLANSVSVFSIPTSANQEDWNSMGANAAWNAYEISELLRRVLSIEVLVAIQAIYLRTMGVLSLLGEGTRRIVTEISKRISFPFHEDEFYNWYLDLIQKFLYVENFD